MQFGLVILAALPTTWAAHAYAVPQSLSMLESSAEDNGCTLPDTYHIRNFKAESKDGGKTLTGFDFTFLDKDTDLTTPCHKNSSSEPITGMGTDRFACDDRAVEFLWDSDYQKLWMMEKVCGQADGSLPYEASGSVMLPLKCARTGSCSTNSTDHKAGFTSLQPSRQAPPS
ncbi:uncharacterized protein B0J16DRAFT_328455 [Fusarium flagelliforme]|uniref:AA1-like domain-containing protein n=1 Tax=Fusarium flagelliforme TaxID=2675880 RepID=A0A395MW31_9HYPO|nr:uncharacterized protein B0J16DRAFT_328455 [Fusarium flagelliforme]KAH7197543.1 hypothetical protein B0J16DRAFT_328455 [Fusarium flagelliforme]RFN51633.1 hypothetical protein FIE12Z_4107 [Fusarium flagelliforme]